MSCADDNKFEGQHFDRKQAGEIDGNGKVSKSAVDNLTKHAEKTMSGFANATGGLLVFGVSKTGEVPGVDHLTENQKSALLGLKSLKGASIPSKLHTVKVGEETRQVALFMVVPDERTFCCRISDEAAWIRKGPTTIRLQGVELDQVKRDRKVVDFERMPADPFDVADADTAVVDEFIKSKGYRKDRGVEDILREAGAINGRTEAWEWSNAGLLFFASNPRRVLAHAYVRLLRFDCGFDDEDERPTPTFDKDFDGTLTEQIRDFRTFVTESGFFKTYELRAPDGGFVSEPEYPPIAIDEAVVNAVAHRDYAIGHPIVCEKYTDAFVVKSPGRLQQQVNVPPSFRLSEFQLESALRNPKLMDWLRSMKDAHGAAYVKAIREGTRRMRDEMDLLGLPSPIYENRPAETRVILRNDAERREAKPTGLALKEKVTSDEFTNLYPLEGLDEGGARSGDREQRRVFLAALCDKLVAEGWVIDKFSKGRVIVHLKGAQERMPDALRKVVRLIPAYELTVRSFYDRGYMSIDFTLQVQSVLTAQEAAARFDRGLLIGLKAFATVDGKAERGRILSVMGDHVTVRLFDSDVEITLPANKLYPNLRRDQLDALVRNAAPNYDLARAIKTAALSTISGAARERARRIAAMAGTLRENVFPVTAGTLTVKLGDQPLRLHEEGDGRRALRISKIQEPDVEFSQKRSTANIRDGITQFGAYQDSPRDIELVAVVEPGFEQPMRDLIARLQVGKHRYKGSEQTFSTRLRLAQVSSAKDIRVDDECRRLVEAYPEWSGNQKLDRVLLVHTPESGFALDDVFSPYYQAKRVLLEAGIPSQMVDSPTLSNPDYKDLNLALNVVAKTGVTPWVLPESIPDADFFVGLSYTSNRGAAMDERVIGFANVFNQYGRWEFYSGGNEAVPYNDREKHYEHLVAETMKKLNLGQSPTIYFHYSAKFSRSDRDAILRGARTIRPHGTYVFVWINTHHPVRLFDERAETDGSVARGRYVIGAGNQIYLSTTGYNQYRKTIGTPQALEINVYVEPGADGARPAIDHRSLARQVLGLTKLNWASTDSLCGEPITTKYAKDIAYLTAAFQRQPDSPFTLHPVLERTPWFI